VRLWPWLGAFSAASLGTLIYGSLYESNRLVLEKHRLRLPLWPKSLDGYRVALLADMHVRDEFTIDLTRRAVSMALAEGPDVVAIAGDFVGYWKHDSPWIIEEALHDLRLMDGRAVGVPGNHDYWDGNPSPLERILPELGVTFLRNGVAEIGGVTWAGMDSANAFASDPFSTMAEAHRRSSETGAPILALWHEPDVVEQLPAGAALMLSGHSHGGQFMFPWGWTPKHTENGRKYVKGFYPEAQTPIYVSRGIGTTGPPSRLCILPEVTVLTLEHGELPERLPC
jgi:uncharacterized protein